MRFAPGASGGPKLPHRALQSLGLVLQRRFVDRVDLGQRDNLGLFGEIGAIGGEFAADRAVVGARVRARRVDKMHERA